MVVGGLAVVLQLRKKDEQGKLEIEFETWVRDSVLTIFEFYSSMLVAQLSLQQCCVVGKLVEMPLPTAEPIVVITVPNVVPVVQPMLECRVKQSLRWKTFALLDPIVIFAVQHSLATNMILILILVQRTN